MTLTDNQLAEHKEKASLWAQERLADQNTVIIDIESTGLLREDPDTEIAQVCILNMQGRTLFSMLLKPSQPMSEKVISIHKISNNEVIDQPTFPQIAKMISYVLKDKHVVAYNAEFDISLLWHMFKKYEIPVPEISGASCAMDKYSEWSGEWSSKKGGFKWQKLPNFIGESSHDAFNDCRNTLKVIEKVAGLYDDKVTEDLIDLDF